MTENPTPAEMIEEHRRAGVFHATRARQLGYCAEGDRHLGIAAHHFTVAEGLRRAFRRWSMDKGEMGAKEARIADLELALSWALSRLFHYEPGDSRAVSDEFVAAARIEAELSDLDGARSVLAQAIEGGQP